MAFKLITPSLFLASVVCGEFGELFDVAQKLLSPLIETVKLNASFTPKSAFALP